MSDTASTKSRLAVFSGLFAVAAWGVLAFIAYSTLAPIRHRPTMPTSVTIQHFSAFAVMAVLFCAAYPRRKAFVCLIVVGSAAILEAMQLLLPDRHARLEDLTEKVLGGCFGIAVGFLLVWLFIRCFRSQADA